MNILFATDEKFAEICTVAMRSIAINDDGVHFFVIQDRVSDFSMSKMKDSLRGFNCEITFIKAERVEEKFNVNIKSGIWPLTTLQRLFLCNYLPSDLNKILYLDCDIIARKSVRSLYDLDLKNDEFCAAVPDCVSDMCRRNIGISNTSTYFNAGVLLINLDLWRREKVSNKFLEIINKKEGKLQYLDQDVMNIAFENKIKVVDAKYNVTSFEYAYGYDELMFYHNANHYIDKTEFENAVNDPYIFHFTNDMLLTRPWISGNNHPFFSEWIAIRKKTAWGNEKLWDNNEKWSVKVKRCLANHLPRKIVLHLAKYINKKHSSYYEAK